MATDSLHPHAASVRACSKMLLDPMLITYASACYTPQLRHGSELSRHSSDTAQK